MQRPATEFEPHFRKSPATDPWEPLFSRRRPDGIDLMFEVATAHCNSRGFLHGGVLAALCDNAMGLSLGAQMGGKPQIVTIGLALDFLGSAKIGERVTIAPRVLRGGGSVGFCDALVLAGERTIARANATFSVRVES
jgi:acyl-coenzyme A thioesterase PaaI-like protein